MFVNHSSVEEKEPAPIGLERPVQQKERKTTSMNTDSSMPVKQRHTFVPLKEMVGIKTINGM